MTLSPSIRTGNEIVSPQAAVERLEKWRVRAQARGDPVFLKVLRRGHYKSDDLLADCFLHG